MMDVILLPPTIFVFSKLPTGWFRAYRAILDASRENWLKDETDIHGTKWLLYFKQHLTQNGPGSLLPPFHAVIEWTHENTVTALEGLPLTARSKWQVLEGGTALVGMLFISNLLQVFARLSISTTITSIFILLIFRCICNFRLYLFLFHH